MKRILAAIMALTMLFAICMVPAMAETTKPSPELGGTTTPGVTSPDTSDVFGLVLGALAVVDGAAVTYYLKSRKAK